MPPTLSQAQEQLTTTRKAYTSARAVHDAQWTVSIALDSGNHWVFPVTTGGQTALKMLRPITDPSSGDARVSMPLIHSHVSSFIDGTNPSKLAPFCDPRSGASEDRIAAELSRVILTNWLKDADGLRILREKDRPRAVLGTAIVRRWMSAAGMNPEADAIKNWTYGWAQVYPWEIIRDPSATSLRPDRDEEIFVHEKPRTVAWVKKHFGISIETTTTLGTLLDYQHQVYAASGLGGLNVKDSKAPAVLVSEAWFQEDGPGGVWPWMFPSYRDPAQASDDAIPLMKQGVIPNPFAGLPFHFFSTDQNIQAMWGFGIPIALRQVQDIINMAWSTMLRYHIMAQGKWLVQENTVEKGNRGLSNRLDEPLFWKRQNAYDVAPSRITPPQVNPVTQDMLAMGPDYMDRILNRSEVMRGVSSKRGESGEALDAKLKAAGSPIERVRRDDDLTYEDMLLKTLTDLLNPRRATIDQVRRWLGPDVPDEQAYILLRKPITEAIKGVTLVAGDVHPKTPQEQQQGVIVLAQAQIIDAEMAQWLLVQQGNDVDPRKSGAYRTQINELDQMKAGQDVPVETADEHEFHLYTVRAFVNSPTWHTLDPAIQDRVRQHYADHWRGIILHQQLVQQAQGSVAQPGMQGQPPQQQPSPPAAATEAAGGMNGAGGMSPALQIA